MKEQNNKLTLACEPIHSVTAACELAQNIIHRENDEAGAYFLLLNKRARIMAVPLTMSPNENNP